MDKNDTANPGNGYIEEGLNEVAAEQPEAVEVDESTQLKQELELQKEETRKNYEQYLRVLADADNTRKRMQRDKEEYMKFSTLPLIKKLLPVVDDLERAIQAAGTSQDYEVLSKGVEMINRRLQDIIREQDVLVIETEGQTFDPQFHQALVVEESREHEENTILEEMQKGYTMHGRVIRPSLVKVSSK
ncbi:MAG: nucleotide exchange factor GrpE [Deltaproteobacteria bacterium]